MTREPDAPDADTELATVRRLPVRQDGELVDGELVDEAEYQRLTNPRTQAAQRLQGYIGDVVVVATTVRAVATHRHTRRTGRALGRHGAYIWAGGQVVWRRWWDAHGGARLERLMRAAEAAGEHDKILQLQERAEQAKTARHQRRMERHQSLRIMALARAVWWGAGATLAGLLALGLLLAVANRDASYILAPILGVLAAIRWTTRLVTWVWGPLILAAPWVLVIVLHQIGRQAGAIPEALAPVAEPQKGARKILPTTGAILDALRNLRIPALDTAFKAGWASPDMRTRVWITDPHRDGKGWRTQIALPLGVPVAKIADVKTKAILAHNLVRKPVEVWPIEPDDQPGVLDLWVADQGSLTGPVPPWPLLGRLDSAECDYFAGVPVGVNIRGDVVNARLFEANYVGGGVMGSGKSTLVIALLAGAILDPLVDIDVRVMADNADFEPMRPRLNSLVTGAGKATVKSCLDLLTEAFEDVQRRGAALREHDERANSRKLALKDARLRPRIIVIDECQFLFMDKKHGEAAFDATVELLSAARKYGITLVFLTPEPTNDGLPRKIVSLCSNKAAFSLGDHTSNDAVMGTGSYRAGVSSVGLKPKTETSLGDVGTCMTRGFSEEPSLLRCYYINQGDAHRITERAMQLWAGSRPAIEPGDEAEVRDLLTDVVEAMGGKGRVRSEWTRKQLADRWPAEYGDWSAQRFSSELGDAGVGIRSGRVDGEGGQRFLALDEVLDVLDGRAELDEDAEQT